MSATAERESPPPPEQKCEHAVHEIVDEARDDDGNIRSEGRLVVHERMLVIAEDVDDKAHNKEHTAAIWSERELPSDPENDFQTESSTCDVDDEVSHTSRIDSRCSSTARVPDEYDPVFSPVFTNKRNWNTSSCLDPATHPAQTARCTAVSSGVGTQRPTALAIEQVIRARSVHQRTIADGVAEPGEDDSHAVAGNISRLARPLRTETLAALRSDPAARPSWNGSAFLGHVQQWFAVACVEGSRCMSHEETEGPVIYSAHDKCVSASHIEEDMWKRRLGTQGVVARMVSYHEGSPTVPSDDVQGLRWSNGRLLVTRLEKHGLADRAGVRVSFELKTIDGWRGFEGCPANAIQASLKAPLVLVFVGFIGSPTAEVRLDPVAVGNQVATPGLPRDTRICTNDRFLSPSPSPSLERLAISLDRLRRDGQFDGVFDGFLDKLRFCPVQRSDGQDDHQDDV